MAQAASYPTPHPPPRVRSAAPVLCVREIAPMREAFVERMGFRVQGQAGDPPSWMSLERDGVEIMLVAGDYPAPAQDWAAYVYVEQVDALYAELEARGADLRGPPVDQPYNSRDFTVQLPDGRLIVFGG